MLTPFGSAPPGFPKSGMRETGSVWRAGGDTPPATAYDPEVDRRISKIERKPVSELV